MPDSPLDVVRSWNAAAKDGDAEALVALAHEDFEMVTMHRGIQRGHDAVRGWLQRQSYGLAMHVEPRRYFQGGETVAVATRVEMRWVESGEVAEVQEGAVVFVVREGRVGTLIVHPDIGAALAATGLAESDEVESP